jgi:hypothetical protein
MTSIGKCSGPSTMFSTLVISMAQRSGPNAAVIACHFPTDRPSAGSSLWFCSVPEKGLTVRRLAAGAKEIRTHGPTPNASVPRAPHGSRHCSRFRSRALLRSASVLRSSPPRHRQWRCLFPFPSSRGRTQSEWVAVCGAARRPLRAGATAQRWVPMKLLHGIAVGRQPGPKTARCSAASSVGFRCPRRLPQESYRRLEVTPRPIRSPADIKWTVAECS